MPKRTFWLVTGAAIGAGSSLWAERKVRRTVRVATRRLQPDALVVEMGRTARQAAGNAGGRVRDAMSSGRDEMQRREEELWAELAAQGEAVSPPAGEAPDSLSEPAGSTRTRTLARLKRPPAESASYLGK